MYQPSYRRKLEAISRSSDLSSKTKENKVNWVAKDPFVIEDNEQQVTEPTTNQWEDNTQNKPKFEVTSNSRDLSNKTKKNKVNWIMKDPFSFEKDPFVIEEEDEKTTDSNNNWKQEREKKQNQTATLLEVQEDEEDRKVEAAVEIPQTKKLETNRRQQAEIERKRRLDALLGNEKKTNVRSHHRSNSKTNKPSQQLFQINYKRIGIDKIEQLNLLKKLVVPNLKQRWNNTKMPIELKGVLAEVNKKKIGLVLVDVSGNNRVAEIISFVVLSKKNHRQVKAKLMYCLEKSLPQFNCDRLKFGSNLQAINSNMEILL